jgi:hypothetical protein
VKWLSSSGSALVGAMRSSSESGLAAPRRLLV